MLAAFMVAKLDPDLVEAVLVEGHRGSGNWSLQRRKPEGAQQ